MKFTLLIGVFLIFACTPKKDNQNTQGEWISLFNGKDLTGWTVKIKGYEPGDNFGNTFIAEDGVMKVNYTTYDTFNDRFGHIFYGEPFSYYHIKLEYRFVGVQVTGGEGWALRNSGIMVHSQAPESMLKEQDFPISIEAQILGGNGVDDRSTMNLCTPGTHVVMNEELKTSHCINSSSKTYHGEQWVTAEMVVKGNEEIIHIVEGDTVMVYQNPQIGGGEVHDFAPLQKRDGEMLSKGFIALQSESHSIEFRNILLKNLGK